MSIFKKPSSSENLLQLIRGKTGTATVTEGSSAGMSADGSGRAPDSTAPDSPGTSEASRASLPPSTGRLKFSFPSFFSRKKSIGSTDKTVHAGKRGRTSFSLPTLSGGGRPFVVGADLRAGVLRLVKMRRCKGHGELVEARQFPVPADATPGSPALAGFLRTRLKEFCGSSKQVELWARIPSSAAEYWFLRIPKVPRNRIVQAAQWSVKKEKPYEDRDFILEVEVQGEVREQDAVKLEIVACLVQRQAVAEVRETFTRAGYPLAGLTTASFAMQALFRQDWLKSRAGTAAVVNVGEAWSRIDIFTGGRLSFNRSFMTGAAGAAQILLETYPGGDGGAAGPARPSGDSLPGEPPLHSGPAGRGPSGPPPLPERVPEPDGDIEFSGELPNTTPPKASSGILDGDIEFPGLPPVTPPPAVPASPGMGEPVEVLPELVEDVLVLDDIEVLDAVVVEAVPEDEPSPVAVPAAAAVDDEAELIIAGPHGGDEDVSFADPGVSFGSADQPGGMEDLDISFGAAPEADSAATSLAIAFGGEDDAVISFGPGTPADQVAGPADTGEGGEPLSLGLAAEETDISFDGPEQGDSGAGIVPEEISYTGMAETEESIEYGAAPATATPAAIDEAVSFDPEALDEDIAFGPGDADTPSAPAEPAAPAVPCFRDEAEAMAFLLGQPESTRTMDEAAQAVAMGPAVDRLIKQLERTFDYYANTLGQKAVEIIYLTGPMAANPAFVACMRSRLGLDCQRFDPLNPALVGAGAAVSMPLAGRLGFGNAVSLALCEEARTPSLVLTFADKEKRRRAALVDKSIVAACTAVLLVLTGVYMWQQGLIAEKEIQLRTLEGELAKFVPKVDQNVLLGMATKIGKKNQAIKDASRRYEDLAVLSEVTVQAGSSIRLLSLDMTFGKPQEDKPAAPAPPPAPPAPAAPAKSPSGTPPAAPAAPSTINRVASAITATAEKNPKVLILEGYALGDRRQLEGELTRFLVRLQRSPLLAVPTVESKEMRRVDPEGFVLYFVVKVPIA